MATGPSERHQYKPSTNQAEIGALPNTELGAVPVSIWQEDRLDKIEEMSRVQWCPLKPACRGQNRCIPSTSLEEMAQRNRETYRGTMSPGILLLPRKTHESIFYVSVRHGCGVSRRAGGMSLHIAQALVHRLLTPRSWDRSILMLGSSFITEYYITRWQDNQPNRW